MKLQHATIRKLLLREHIRYKNRYRNSSDEYCRAAEHDIEFILDNLADTVPVTDTDAPVYDNYYPFRCMGCGHHGMSNELGGGVPLADTGDHTDVECPVCGSPRIEDPTCDLSRCSDCQQNKRCAYQDFQVEHDRIAHRAIEREGIMVPAKIQDVPFDIIHSNLKDIDNALDSLEEECSCHCETDGMGGSLRNIRYCVEEIRKQCLSNELIVTVPAPEEPKMRTDNYSPVESHFQREFRILRETIPDSIVLEFEDEITALCKKVTRDISGSVVGAYAATVSNVVKDLILLLPIAGVQNIESEWVQVGDDRWQNVRCPLLFKSDINGQPYYIDAVIFREPNENMASGYTPTFTTNNICVRMPSGLQHTLRSRGYPKSFPFQPKSFFIDVERLRKKDAVGDCAYRLLEPTQLFEAQTLYTFD